MESGTFGPNGLLQSTPEKLRNATDIIFVKDESLRYIDASQAFCNLFGFLDPEFVSGKTDNDLFPRSIAEAAYADDRAVLQSAVSHTSFNNNMLVTKSPLFSSDGRIIGLSGVICDIACNPNDVNATARIDVNNWLVTDIKFGPAGRGLLPDQGSVADLQRHLLDSVATDDTSRAFVASVSPAMAQHLRQLPEKKIYCACGHSLRIEVRAYEESKLQRPMMELVVRAVSDIKSGINQANVSFLRASARLPIRIGGTFSARLSAGLPITYASEGFTKMLGHRERTGWIHPEDAAILQNRILGTQNDLLSFPARLTTANNEIILARLECRVFSDRTGFSGAAYNLSDKTTAERAIAWLHTANAIIERLSSSELDFLSLIDAHTGEMTVIRGKTAVTRMFPGDQFNYTSLYERYFRERAVTSNIDDCIRRMSLDVIVSELAQNGQYETSFSIHEGDEIRRKRWLFSYLDENRETIIHMRNDITDSYMMQFDPVSGLYNRHQFQREARKQLDAHPEKSYLFVRFDMDNFHTFNDLYGVSAGNRLIASLKELLASFDVSHTVCGHIEADHFACLLPQEEYGHMPNMRMIINWLKSHSPSFDFSPKIGIYVVNDITLDIEVMSNRALLALNSIKGTYGAHIAFYTEAMRERMLHEQSIVNDMSSALENGEFEPYIQPQYNYGTGKMVGAELLLRWNHPQKGILAPGDFVPIFESNGFINEIDKHVWEVACRTQRRWIDMNLPIVPLSVNVSRADINDPNLCRTLQKMVETYALNPKLIHLEITETAYLKNPEQLIDAVKKLRLQGFIVEMDDFGSGYSSLNMLRDVEVDALKLDMSFLKDHKVGTRSESILRLIVRMARLLKIPLIAEGVETKEQADYLAQAGCTLMQGYYFARPMRTQEFEERLLHVNSTDGA